MSKISSEYQFPIFISSTDYNLIDLRAELSKHLSELGYKPILSSAEGFHDNTPSMEPWESCLQVLQSCYIMILVIDGRYGEKLEWKNFEKVIGDRKVSPTHAEYIFAHKSNMRMLVFIRSELLTYYQNYRILLKNFNNDKAKAIEMLKLSLPSRIQSDIFEFIEEVKTSRPIPWIKEFDNVTDIKSEVQKKMLNELAELFLFRSKHLESIIKSFSSVLEEMTEEKRRETLEKIGVTNAMIIQSEKQTEAIGNLKKEKEKLSKDLEDANKKLKVKAESKEMAKKIAELKDEINILNGKIQRHEDLNTNIIIGANSSSIDNMNIPLLDLYQQLPLPPYFSYRVCDKCGSDPLLQVESPSVELRECPECNRKLCFNCFGSTNGFSDKCWDCRSKN